jgi:uncharacterized protein (DUF1800 family)
MASIAPKTNVLGYDNAAHLLKRATYSINKDLIEAYALKTPQQALDDLFQFSEPNPSRPLNDLNQNFIPTFYEPNIQASSSGQQHNVVSWYEYKALTTPTIQFKLLNWLHTLFIASIEGRGSANIFDYLELLKYHTNGSLQDLAIRISRDILMAIYLDNRFNTLISPNQNYAREFLELFTILKGPQIAPDHYTNYTEHDVQQAARVLTGFTINSNSLDATNRITNVDPVTKIPRGIINIAAHDSGNKTFSAAFNNTVIQGSNTQAGIQQELVQFVAMVFNQPETAKNYCRRMYRYFVSSKITPEIETDIITPLAATMMDNNYNIEPVVKQLLCSQHFYDEDDSIIADEVIGALIKSPLELCYHLYNIFEISLPNYATNAASINSFIRQRVHNASISCSFNWLNPVNVNGYPAYSDTVHYDKNWITTSSLRQRYLLFIDQLIHGFTISGHLYRLNIHTFVKNSGHFSNPANADILLQEFYDLLFTATPQGARHTYFREALLGGLSVINWQMDWNAYINTNNHTAVKIALDRLVNAMVKSPEYQVM